jgi:hypothetical protein
MRNGCAIRNAEIADTRRPRCARYQHEKHQQHNTICYPSHCATPVTRIRLQVLLARLRVVATLQAFIPLETVDAPTKNCACRPVTDRRSTTAERAIMIIFTAQFIPPNRTQAGFPEILPSNWICILVPGVTAVMMISGNEVNTPSLQDELQVMPKVVPAWVL